MVNQKRKATEEFIIKYISKIVSGEENVTLYKNLFVGMSDSQFHTFMENLRDNKITLCIIVPTGSKHKVDVENNFKVAKELGYDFFQHIHVTSDGELPDYVTPEKYLIFKLPIKRAAQLLSKGIAIPENARSIDMMSGQVTGKSRSSTLTMPELQILLGIGLKDTILELMKVRGGDLGAANAMNTILYKQGGVSQDLLRQYSTGVVSTKTLNSMFNAAHIKTTLT